MAEDFEYISRARLAIKWDAMLHLDGSPVTVRSEELEPRG